VWMAGNRVSDLPLPDLEELWATAFPVQGWALTQVVSVHLMRREMDLQAASG